MKPLITLLTGFIVGALLCAALLLLNPMFDGSPANDSRGSPLALTVAGQGAVTVMQNATGYPGLPRFLQPPLRRWLMVHAAMLR